MNNFRNFISTLLLKTSSILKSKGAFKTYSSIICILISLIIGLIFLICMDPVNAFPEFGNLITGGLSFGSVNFFAILAKTAPLLCCGLSIVFANKTGMFNIGVAGQYTIGVLGSLMFALQFKCPWYVCILMSMVFGAIWAAIPGLLKAFCNVSEVISGIMLNWIALFFTNYSFQTYLNGCVDLSQGSKTYAIEKVNQSALIPDWGLSSATGGYFTISIFIAIIVAILVWFIMKKTTLGFQLKASGLNKDATKYAGIKEKRNIIISMSISGALAALGASLYYLSGLEEWSVQASTALPQVPWNGIVVAFVGQLSPIGTIFASMFTTLISHGSRFMLQTSFPAEIGDFITGLIVYLSGLTNLALILVNKYLTKKKEKQLQDGVSLQTIVQETNGDKNEGEINSGVTSSDEIIYFNNHENESISQGNSQEVKSNSVSEIVLEEKTSSDEVKNLNCEEKNEKGGN